MSDQLTRRQLMERAALGGAVILVPGWLAACGSSGKKAGGHVSHKLAKTLHLSVTAEGAAVDVRLARA